MQKVFRQITSYIIFIGVLAFVINLMFGQETINMIVQEETNGITYYKIDVWKYINNIQTSFSQTTYLTLEQPSRTWENITENLLQGAFWEKLGNNLALMLDWMIFGLNVILYPFRIGAYVLKEALVFIGVNFTEETTHGLTWLVDLVNFLVKLAIPYV